MEKSPHPLLCGLGARVRELRASRDWTRRQLAKASGVSERFLVSLEGGSGNISVARLASVASALGTTADHLLTARAAQARDGNGHQAIDSLLAGRAPGELEEIERWLKARFGAGEQRRLVALWGLRGAGKSTIGAKLAKRLGVPFIEVDRQIEAAAGLSLSELFAIHGEEYYRRLERQVLERLLEELPAGVLATGGGVVNNGPALELLARRCLTVWLKAEPQDHWERVVRQGDRRPMGDNPRAMAELKSLLAARAPLYARAHTVVDTSALGVAGSVKVLSSLQSSRPRVD